MYAVVCTLLALVRTLSALVCMCTRRRGDGCALCESGCRTRPACLPTHALHILASPALPPPQGSVVRAIRRLEELLRQLTVAMER